MAPLVGAVLEVPISYAPEEGSTGKGVEMSVTVIMLNAGLSYRNWDEDIEGWNNKEIRDELSLYAGIGLGPLLQVQGGFSNGGSRLRFKSDLSLDFTKYSSKYLFMPGYPDSSDR